MAQTLNREIIEAAIAGFEQKRSHIDAQIAELRSMLTGTRGETAGTTTPHNGRRRGKMSAEGRARIAAAQKARWAKVRGESAPAPAEVAKPKRKLSAAGRRNIVAALKKRWAANRAETAAKSKTAAKKTAMRKVAAQRTAPAKAAKRAPAKKTIAKMAQTAEAPSTAQAVG